MMHLVYRCKDYSPKKQNKSISKIISTDCQHIFTSIYKKYHKVKLSFSEILDVKLKEVDI